MDELTADADLLAQLRRNLFRRLALAVPDGHALLWFDMFPLAGALVYRDAPLWVCHWQLRERVAIINDWRAFWYTNHQTLKAIFLVSER